MSRLLKPGWWVLGLTVVCALILSIWPLPGALQAFRPAWVALVVIYWCLALPGRFGVVSAWILGLLLDVLHGGLLGAHALALTLVAFVALRSHLQVRMFPLWQQSLVVAVLVGLYTFTLYWVDGLSGRPVSLALRMAPVLLSVLLWPLVFIVLRNLRRRYRLA